MPTSGFSDSIRMERMSMHWIRTSSQYREFKIFKHLPIPKEKSALFTD